MAIPLEVSSTVIDGTDPRNRDMDPTGAVHMETRHGFFAVIDEMTPRRGRRGRVAGPGMPLDAAQRAIRGSFEESPQSPSKASLRALLGRVACAVRQVYEALWVGAL